MPFENTSPILTGNQKRAFRRKLWEQLKFVPHPKQEAALDNESLIKALMWGKKAGKTTTLKMRRVERLIMPRPQIYCATFATTYKQVRLTFDPVCDMLRFLKWPFIIDHSKSDPPYVKLRNLAGEIVEYRGVSVEDPKSLVGFKFPDADIDEAGLIPNETFYAYIGPNVYDFMAVGTPTDSENWFSKLYEQGQDPNRDKNRYWSVNIRQQDNIRMDGYSADGNHTGEYADLLAKAVILERDYPETYRTDILGLPSVSGYRYFGDMDVIWDKGLAEKWDRETGIIIPPAAGEYYGAGWDLGRYRDWTVGTVFNRKRQLCYLKIMDKQDFESQEKEIAWQIEHYRGGTNIDSTGMGSQLSERMAKKYGECVNGIVFNQKGITRATMRDEIIANLNFAIVDARQNKTCGLRMPRVLELVDGFGRVVVTRTDGGQERIGDSSGHLPDVVSSAALALWNLRHLPLVPFDEKDDSYEPATRADGFDEITGMPYRKEDLVEVFEGERP